MAVVINLLILVGLAFWIDRKIDPDDRMYFRLALAVKWFAGITLGWLYLYYYYGSGDTFNYFDQAAREAQGFLSHPSDYFNFLWHDDDLEWKGISRSLFFVKIVSLAAIVTGGNYWIASLWLSSISFAASFFLFKTVTRFFGQARISAALAFLFFPSIVFWGSGIIKESLALAALMVLAAVYLKSMMKQFPSGIDWVLAALSLWIGWQLKYYWISVFLPVAISSFTVQFLAAHFKLAMRYELLTWLLVFLILCTVTSQIHPNFYPARIMGVIMENNLAFIATSAPNDLAHYSDMDGSWLGLIRSTPLALWSGLFRPMIWEGDNPLKFVAALENTLLLALFVLAIIRVRVLFTSPYRLIILSVILYSGLLCVFLALSTPNFGSLARYRIGFLPFVVFVAAYGVDRRTFSF